MRDPTMATQLHKLSLPFAKDDIKLLPKPLNPNNPIEYCELCGGHHSLPAQHIRYVGHAALTKRLLDVDPLWNWQPLVMNQDGTPRFDAQGGLWIELTVCGLTRLGYGHADGKSGGNAIKETIGDALRNAAMRFGAALELWHDAQLTQPEPVDLQPKHEAWSNTAPTANKPAYPQALFERNLPTWLNLIQNGQTHNSIRHKLETTYTLSTAQIAALATLGEHTHANH
ncbi:hypothetical protein [Hydromonas duriensis]|uniref:Rad52/22 family double-strand break repair protein n=1 Tax=Hydromonas duriensis TaxID=1527608 RepID=A0A4V3DJL5_9BURK|nr:hypothetical protein [Hydromonas duriensis]TDR30659.1 hypothetical protein DFR44_1186 [Hydromonas duriensis]